MSRRQAPTDQVTKDQHFVPSFYLKAFGSADGHVRVLDLKTFRVQKRKHHKAVGYARFFYARKTGVPDEISQAFELWFRDIESQIADRLPAIIEAAKERRLDNSHFVTLAYFMAFQWMRTDAFRMMVNTLNESLTRRVMDIRSRFPGFADEVREQAAKAGTEVTDEEIAAYQNMAQLGAYDLDFDNTTHLKFITPDALRGFHNLLLGQQWTVIGVEASRRFVTSDNPVAVGLPRAQGIYGLSFLERTHCLPLTPDLLIETAEPEQYAELEQIEPAKTARYRTANDTEVVMYNILQLRRARQFGYSRARNDLDAVLAEFENTGPALRLYIERFEQQEVKDARRRQGNRGPS